jgi:hypothetical protein
MKALQQVVTAKDRAEAEMMLEGSRIQMGFLGGRVLPPSAAKPDWRVQIFFEDEPEISDSDIQMVGMRRVTILPSQRRTLGLRPNPARNGHRRNPVTAVFSPEQIQRLRAEYSKLERMPVNKAEEFSRIISKLPDKALLQLVSEKIPWVSSVSRNEMRRRGLKLTNPVRVRRLASGRYRVKSKGRVKAAATTHLRAMRQASLLRGVKRGWKPTGQPARDVRAKMAKLKGSRTVAFRKGRRWTIARGVVGRPFRVLQKGLSIAGVRQWARSSGHRIKSL